MITIDKKLFFTRALIVLDDESFESVVKTKPYSYVSAISYERRDIRGWKVKEKKTALIDLVATEEVIFKRFNDTTRNEIRRTYTNEGMTVSQDTGDFEELYRLYSNFERKQGRKPISRDEMKRYIPFAVKYKGEIISGQFVMDARPYLRIRSIFSKRLDSEGGDMRKVISNAGRRLMWEICRWGKREGFASLDVASVNDSDPKSSSIARFKMAFGGVVITEYTHTYKSIMYRLFERIRRLV